MASLRDMPSRQPTAAYLIAFRNELAAGGIDAETVRELVYIAAKIAISDEGLCVAADPSAP